MYQAYDWVIKIIYKVIYMKSFINIDTLRKLKLVEVKGCKLLRLNELCEGVLWAWDSLQGYCIYDKCYRMEFYYLLRPKTMETSTLHVIKEKPQEQRNSFYPYKGVWKEPSKKINIFEIKIRRHLCQWSLKFFIV